MYKGRAEVCNACPVKSACTDTANGRTIHRPFHQKYIEWAFREVRRRTRPMSCLNDPASCERIIYGVVSHLNRSWEDKPLRQFTH